MDYTSDPDDSPQNLTLRAVAAGRVLELLHRDGPLTRAAVTSQLQLARSAVGSALEELTSLGLVRSRMAPPAGSPGGRGRPSPLLEVDPSGPVAITVQVRPGAAAVGVVGLARRIHHVDELRLAGVEQDPDMVARLVGDAIRRTARKVGRPCVGACVALPGFVREPDGFVQSSLHLGWNEVPFAERLAAHLPGSCPVTIRRASSLAALAEYRYGAGRGATSALVLNCEHVGVGGGFITAGTLLTGAGHALEAGHTIVEPRGRQCRCGARGCLEMYADARALLRAAGFSEEEAFGAGDKVAEILSRAASGDPTASRAVQTTAGYLTVAMTSLVNTLGPERIILLGFMADLYRAAGEQIHTELVESSVVAREGQVAITIGSLAHPVLLGAADRAFTRLFTDPRRIL